MKNRQGFTMLEIMVAVVILAVLASISVAGYQGYRDRANMLIDETNQKVLQAAVRLYAYDNNVLPGGLGQLRPQDFQRAYAQVSEGKRPYSFAAYLNERVTGRTAEAVILPGRYYQNDLNILRCPNDTNGGVSYQINSAFSRRPLSVLLLPANAGLTLIFESDTGGDNGADEATETVFRHRGGTRAVGTTVSGAHFRIQGAVPVVAELRHGHRAAEDEEKDGREEDRYHDREKQ